MHRYSVLAGIVTATVTGLSALSTSGSPPRPGFKILYSNDTTNITSCTSPYHAPRADFSDDMLRAGIDEAAAADVHLLQPGMGWIPWWKSKVYPAEEHYRYHQERYGQRPNTYGKYMLAGGDMVKTFVEHCRKRGITPFVSLRLNDAHGLEDVGKGAGMAMHTVSRFYEDNYLQYRLGPNQASASHHVLNWAIPEVRAHKFAFLRELCEGYDLDGIELDFLRFPAFFQENKTTSQQRRQIMTEFVGRVRRELERTARDGLFRLMTRQSMRGCTWTVDLNGTQLEPADFVRKPLAHPYEGYLGQPEQYACFRCPRAAVRPGTNVIRAKLVKGDPTELIFLDVVLP